jgi:hypothetical protein
MLRDCDGAQGNLLLAAISDLRMRSPRFEGRHCYGLACDRSRVAMIDTVPYSIDIGVAIDSSMILIFNKGCSARWGTLLA